MKKCLILTKKAPYPSIDGETMVIMSDIKALKNLEYKIDVLSLNTQKHYADYTSIPSEALALANFQKVDIDTSINIFYAFINIFKSSSYVIDRFWSVEFNEKLKVQLLIKYDVIIIEGLTMMLYFDTIKSVQITPVYLRAHNVESHIWQRLADTCNNFFKKKYLSFSANRIKKFEIDALKKVDGCIAISTEDEIEIKKYSDQKSTSIALSIEIENILNNSSDSNSIFFIGSFDWMPNVEGIIWFIDKVFSLVLKEVPDTILKIAGRNFDQKLVAKHPNIHCIGEVESSNDFIIQNHIMIVPLHSGSGIRIKIIEGMMLGKPIVSTSVGAEGIDVTDGMNIMLADDKNTFAAKIITLLKDEKLKNKISNSAKEFAFKNYSSEMIQEKLASFLKV
jgi:polysaccharide biosynthesis protein PslH